MMLHVGVRQRSTKALVETAGPEAGEGAGISAPWAEGADQQRAVLPRPWPPWQAVEGCVTARTAEPGQHPEEPSVGHGV